MKTSIYVGVILSAVLSFGANAALISRLGGQAAYDDVLDITWVTNAGLNGANKWDNQVAWANSLNASSYLGFSEGWRLAYISVASGAGPHSGAPVVCSTATELACRDNEMGYMLYHNLASIAGIDKTGTHTVGDVTLTNIQGSYWSGTEYSFDALAFYFRFDDGLQWSVDKNFKLYGWAVRDGDVGAVPIPAAAWLFGSALLGLAGIGRNRKQAA